MGHNLNKASHSPGVGSPNKWKNDEREDLDGEMRGGFCRELKCLADNSYINR